jgi:hypothetical protein
MRLATDNEAYYTCSSLVQEAATHVKDTYYNDLTINTQIQSELDAFEDFKGIVFAYAIMNKKDPSQMRIINNSPEWFTIYLKISVH